MSENLDAKAKTRINRIIKELGGSYADDIDSSTKDYYRKHAVLLYGYGMSLDEIDETINKLFSEAAGNFGF